MDKNYQLLIALIHVTCTLANKTFPTGYVTSNLPNQPLVPTVVLKALDLAETAIAQYYLTLFNLAFEFENDLQAAMTNLVAADNLVKSSNLLFEQGQRNFMLAVYPYDILTPLQIGIRRTGSEPRSLNPNSSRRRRAVPQSDANVCANMSDSKNWTAEGVVSPPQDQGDCANCYIFSSVSALESAISIMYQTPPEKLSEQQLTDCVRDPGQPSILGGCNRGRAEWVWNTTKNYEGAVLNSDYTPYSATDNGGCNESISKEPNSQVDSWVFNPVADEEALKCSLALNGPHHISMDFTGPIQNYKSGIYDDPTSNCNSSFVNGQMVKAYTHALTLVGYGSELNNAGVMTDFWLIKNSYGADWGINGYLKLARNQNNLCHVATDAAYPILSSSTSSNANSDSKWIFRD